MGLKMDLWVEKYRPVKIEDLILDTKIVDLLRSWINIGDVPNILFSGSPGSGKTTIAKILISSIPCEYIYINASDERGIDTFRDRVKDFICSKSLSGRRIVVLDESDYITAEGQAILRGYLEEYSSNARFIMTCNYHTKIINPILSRLQHIHLKSEVDKIWVTDYLSGILKNEKVKFESTDVSTIVSLFYPDIRKCINELQKNVINNNLQKFDVTSFSSDIMKEIVKGDITAIRTILSVSNPDYLLIYRSLFEKFSTLHTKSIENKETVGKILITIAEYLYRHEFVVDKEINFIACIILIMNHLKTFK